MIRIYNIDENDNISISDEKGIFKILEHKMNLSSKSAKEAMENYYLNRANVYRKQLLISLHNESVCINGGSMQYMAGEIKIKTNVTGMGDLINKAISSSLTGEGMIKPRYIGTGYIVLEPTYKYIILEELKEEKGIVISDGTFLACSGGVKMKSVPVSSLSSAALGHEGMFHLLLKGNGVISFTSPVPKSDITIVHLQNDILRVNGNYALAWSETLSFTVESSSTFFLGAAVAGKDAIVNVYRGTGTIWLANDVN